MFGTRQGTGTGYVALILVAAFAAMGTSDCEGKCRSDSDCDENEICVASKTFGHSHGQCTPVAECESDADCDDGDACTTDSCEPLVGCSNEFVMCGPGQECDPLDGECVATCSDCLVVDGIAICLDDLSACLGTNDCDVNATCADAPPPIDFTCTCDPGFTDTGSALTGECIDTDGCSPNPCDDDGDAGGTCVDVAAPNSGNTCMCSAGFVASPESISTCVNRDECTDGTNDCDVNATCADTDPPIGFSCTCNTGYVDLGSARTGECIDIDGCQPNPCDDDGDAGGTCADVAAPGTGNTCMCSPGFVASGSDPTTCVVDTCPGTNDCDVNATCATAPPPTDFTCACNPGYTDLGAARTGECIDTPGCSLNFCDDSGDAGATCVDVAAPGTGNTCMCSPGFVESGSDPTTCVERDECTDGTNDCDVNATCTDLDPPAGFTCGCNAGYVDLGSARTGECIDTNGCSPNSCDDDGDAGATCVDVAAPGTGNTCMCSLGFVESGSNPTTCVLVGCADTSDCGESEACYEGECIPGTPGGFCSSL